MKRMYAPKANTTNKYVQKEENDRDGKKFLIPFTEYHANKKKPFQQPNKQILKFWKYCQWDQELGSVRHCFSECKFSYYLWGKSGQIFPKVLKMHKLFHQ